MSKIITLPFEGPRQLFSFENLPKYSGVFYLTECKPFYDNNCIPLNIIYIGSAKNIQSNILGNPIITRAIAETYRDNTLYVNCAEVTCGIDRLIAEAALVFHHKPPLNVQLKDSFNFDQTTIIKSGDFENLKKEFTVSRTNNQGRRIR